MTTRPVLGYWNTRALAESIRLLLAYAGVDYEDRRYEVGPPPAYDKSEWNNEKKKNSLGLSFPNLPYWSDPAADVNLCQTHAILIYLGEAHGLGGTDTVERARAVMCLEAVRDWFYALFDVTYCDAPGVDNVEEGVHKEGADQAATSARFEAMRAKYVKSALVGFVASFAKELRKNGGPWITGARLTFADFALFECVDQNAALHPPLLDTPGAEPLRDHHRRFLALPGVAAYRSSDRFHAEPLHNRYSHMHRLKAATTGG